MAKTTDWQKRVASEVIREFALQGITQFDPHRYTVFARRAATRNGAGYGSVSMHVRMIKPLVERGFGNKLTRAREALGAKTPKKAFVVTPRMRLEALKHEQDDHLSDP